MPFSTHTQDQLTRAVRETLDSVVSPSVRDTLIGQALSSAAEPTIPADPARFRRFLDGPLQDALMRALGTELGRSVTRELDRVTEPLVASRMTGTPLPRRVLLRPRSNPPSTRSASGRPRSDRPARRPTPIDVPRPTGGRMREPSTTPTMPPVSLDRAPPLRPMPSVPVEAPAPSSSGRRPVVLVASRDVDAMGRFGALLDPRAAVVRVARLIDLLIDLRGAAEQRRVVIVLDCRHAPFRPHALAAVAEELGDDARIVLWGASRELAAELHAISPRSDSWMLCPPGMTDSEVASRCAEIVR